MGVLRPLLAVILSAPCVHAQTLEERVNSAIDKGVAWLLKEQQSDGSWKHGPTDRFPAGITALGFLTLVKSGVAEREVAIQRCLRYFDDYRPFEKTYSTGVLLMAWEALKRGQSDVPRAEAGAKWLMEHRDKTTKLWAYPEGDVDLSNTQYAILGLYAASRMGVKIPKEFFWESILAISKRHQERNGGSFTYTNVDAMGLGSMTVGAIAALRIAALELKGFGPYESKRQELDAIEKSAFAWLERNYRINANPMSNTGQGFSRGWHHYYMYGLERVCALAGKKKIGNHAWYPEGAELLIATQQESGLWESDLPKTCFALLFLKRATLTWSDESKRGTGEIVGEASVRVPQRPPTPNATVSYLKSWLVVGPFPCKPTHPLGEDEIGEVTIRSAKAGEKAGSSSKKWLDSGIVNNWILELSSPKSPLREFSGACAYAFTTVSASKEQDAILWLGHDDGAKAWLNGKPIYEAESYGESAERDTYFVPIHLKAGTNTLLVKVYNASHECGVAARISSPSGAMIE